VCLVNIELRFVVYMLAPIILRRSLLLTLPSILNLRAPSLVLFPLSGGGLHLDTLGYESIPLRLCLQPLTLPRHLWYLKQSTNDRSTVDNQTCRGVRQTAGTRSCSAPAFNIGHWPPSPSLCIDTTTAERLVVLCKLLQL
jgi:hypothetical protein